MSGANDDARNLRSAASRASILAAAGALVAMIPADMIASDTRSAEEVYLRVRPVRHLVLDDPTHDGPPPVAPRDPRIHGDLLHPLGSPGNFPALSYFMIPLISNDGKLAFFRETGGDEHEGADTAILFNIDRGSVIWEKLIAERDGCGRDDTLCEERVNARQRAINTELAPHGWVWPELSGNPRPLLGASCPCGVRVQNADPVKVVWPELTVTFASPRLLVVASNGAVLVDKRFPPYVPPDPPPDADPCEENNFPNAWRVGFDRERRVMFISLHYCGELCGSPKRLIHIFRMPKL